MAIDPSKRKSNLLKHQIDLAECEAVFDEPMLTREDGRESYGEQRLMSLAWSEAGLWCWCGPTVTMALD